MITSEPTKAWALKAIKGLVLWHETPRLLSIQIGELVTLQAVLTVKRPISRETLTQALRLLGVEVTDE